MAAYLNDPTDLISIATLSDLVQETLELADVNLAVALEEFGPCIQQWCPIMLEQCLRGGMDDLSQQMSREDVWKSPLLWLCLWLVTRRICAYREHIDRNDLYRTVKEMHALLQTRKELRLEAVQLGMLITIYEVGHGLQIQACQTLAGSVALLQMLWLAARKGKDTELIETAEWLKVSMLMLDRYVALDIIPNTVADQSSMILISLTSDSVPIILSSNNSISKMVAKSIGSDIPAPSPQPHPSSPRKVHIRAAVSLAAGHVQEYIHARHHDLEPEETYDEVDEMINACIRKLVDKPEPHTWLHCDAIAMAFWYGPYLRLHLNADLGPSSNILLQTSQMQHLCAILHHPHTLDMPCPEYIKVHLALKYSRRMAWDMVRVAIQKIPSEAEIPYLPFAGLCCVLRAGLAVLETKDFVNEDVVEDGEVHGFKQILEWFARRWGIGGEYLNRLEGLLARCP
jgi:hypothetical protein